jgi:hypothetical protein
MGITEAQNRASLKYKKKAYKRVPLDMKIEEYEKLKEYLDKTGESVNGFIRRIIKENIE